MSRPVLAVTVGNPAGRSVLPPPAALTTGAERVLLVGASALVLAGGAVLAGITDGPARVGLVSVDSAAPGTLVDGVQEVLVTVRLRNLGRTPLHVVAARFDGAGPVTGTGSDAVDPGSRRALVLRWLVRCAEVGSLPGPQAVTLLLRDRAGRTFTRSLSLADAGRAVRRTASESCATGAP